jgi:hypothetical protein
MLGFCAPDVKLRHNTLSTCLDLWRPALTLWFPVVVVTLADVLSLAVLIAEQRRGEIRVCPNPTDLLIDILAQVGYIEDTTPIAEVRISQVFS